MIDIETKVPDTKTKGRTFQLVWSLILFFGFVTLLFVPNIAPLHGSIDIKEFSLWSFILRLFKGELVTDTISKAALYAFVGFYAVLLVCTVAAFFAKSKGAFVLNCIKCLVAVGVSAFFVYSLMRNEISFADIFRDEKTYLALSSTVLTMALGILGIIVLVFSRYKAFGVVKFVSFLLTLGAFVFALEKFKFIETYTFESILRGLTLADGFTNTMTAYALRALAWGTLANAALTLILITLPRTGIIDVVRTAIMSVIGIAAVVLLGLFAGFGNLFDYLGTVGFAGIALIQLIFAIIVAAVLHARKAKQKEELFVVGKDNQMAMKGLEAQTESASAPATEPQEAARANAAFEDAAQISIEDIQKEETAEKESETETSETTNYDEAIRETPSETEEEEPSFDFEQAKYDGKFNRAYADFAEKQEQQAQQASNAQQAEQQAPIYENFNGAAQQPYYGNGYAAQQQPTYGQPYGTQPPVYGQPMYNQTAQPYYAQGYIPDAFFSSLTPAEKEEFDRLFISRVYGENKRLPAYRIGADNREFFTKIFVFMGRYRNIISDGLLEKIYNYSNSIR